MTTVLLSGHSFASHVGGTEQFSRLAEKMIPGIIPLFSDVTHFPFFTEPVKAHNVAQKLTRELDKLNPETVLFSGMYGWALPSKTSYRKIGICHGTFASFARNAMPWSPDRVRTEFIYSQFERRSFANADLVISNSKFTQSCLLSDYGINSIPVPLATDEKAFHKKGKMKKELGLPEKPVILFVGRPDFYKGFDRVEALARMHPEWHFVSITAPTGKSDVVECRGPFSFDETINYYHACDVVLFPSRFESFGYVTIEALMAHKPVVTTPFGIAREINHPYCIVPPSSSVEDFSRAITQALALPKRVSFSSIEKEFSLPRMKEAYHKILNSTENKA